MPKIQTRTRKKHCHYCSVEVDSSNWARHCKSKSHLARESAAVRRSDPDSEDEFVLAEPTVIPQPGPSAEDSEPEVLEILKKQNKIPSLASKKSGTGNTDNRGDKKGPGQAKRDKASLNFLITAHSKRKYVYARCMLHWSKCYVIGREFNNGGFGRKCHLHIYVKLDLKMKLTEFKEKMTSHGLRVDDIQTCKNVPAAIRYVTKEDRIPFNCGVDWSKLNWLCKLKVIAEQMEFIDNTHPAVVSIPHVYRCTFRNYHSQFWDEINRGLLFDLTDEPTDIDKYYRIKGFFEMDWLGVYVFGAPGVGKSLTTLYLSKFDVFYVNMNSVRFALSGYHGEPVILFDEIEDYGQWRHLLLSLGGKLPFAYDVKGCNPRIMYPHKLKKVVLTSNMPYDAFTQDGAFRRRYIRCPMDPR